MAQSQTLPQQQNKHNLVALQSSSIATDSTTQRIDSTTISFSLENIKPKKDSVELPVFTTNIDSLLAAKRTLNPMDSLTLALDRPLGMTGLPLSQNPKSLDGFILIFILALILTTCAYSLGTRFYTQFFKNLFSGKERISFLFESTLTGFEFKSCLTIQTILLEGLIYYNLIREQIYGENINKNYIMTLSAFMVITAAYHIIRGISFVILGNIFSNKSTTRSFISEYFTLLSLWGTWLLPISLFMVFSQINIYVLATLLIIPALLIRIITIHKGVKIFFNNLRGTFYIFLYLCALEIMPLIALFSALMATFSKL